MNFIPFVSVAAVGAKVVFANSNPFPHNVFSPTTTSSTWATSRRTAPT